jgi:hypothetical protein
MALGAACQVRRVAMLAAASAARPRVAVTFIGQVRSLDLCAPSIRREIVEPLRNAGYAPEVHAHLSLVDTAPAHSPRRNCNQRHTHNRTRALLLSLGAPLVTLLTYTAKEPPGPFDGAESCGPHQHDKVQMHRLWKHVVAAEAASRYSYVLRLRTDVVYDHRAFALLDWGVWKSSQRAVWAPCKCHRPDWRQRGLVQDVFWAMSRGVAETFFAIVGSVRRCRPRGLPRCPYTDPKDQFECDYVAYLLGRNISTRVEAPRGAAPGNNAWVIMRPRRCPLKRNKPPYGAFLRSPELFDIAGGL